MKKSLLEQLERQTQLMSFMEQSPIAAGITQAIKSGIIKSTLASLFDDEDFDDQDFDLDTKSTNVSGNVTPLTKTTPDDEFYKSILKGIGAPISDENMKFFYAWRQAEGGKAKNNPFNTGFQYFFQLINGNVIIAQFFNSFFIQTEFCNIIK